MDYEYVLDTFLELPRKAQIILLKYKNFEILDDFYLMSYENQSPIEQIYLIALMTLQEVVNFKFCIETQYLIECENKKYYGDFAICHYECLHDDLKEDFRLVIECDGYEFHQKTKEQVEKDNKREYDIKMQGFEILRFSGKEIYNDAMGCALKTLKYIAKRNELKIGKDFER